MDPDPALLIIDLQDVSKKLIFEHNFFCLLLFEATFISFYKDRSVLHPEPYQRSAGRRLRGRPAGRVTKHGKRKRDRKEKEHGTVQEAGRPAARERGAGNEGGRVAWLSATAVYAIDSRLPVFV
jgi:hypothetical protein